MLKRCEDTNLVLNWEKCHFMYREGIVLGHKISKSGIEVDRAKVKEVMPLSYLTLLPLKGTLKKKLTKAPILVVPDWNLPFELMCDASDFAIGAVLRTTSNEALSAYNIIFGTPRAIISDRGTHFCNDQFGKVMSKYGVTHRLVTAYHPQTSGQVKVSNRGLKLILERTVGENRTSWSDKLDDALWSFHTAFKTPIGCTPYKLVYGKSCHLPIELEHKAYWALKHANFDLKTAGDHRKLQLNELNELRDQAYENSLIYKERTKKLHDSKIKNCIFNVGDRVLLFNSHLKIFSGKLKTRWSGPFTITKVFPYGTIKLSQPDGPNFKVNSHCVKHYFGGVLPPKDWLSVNDRVKYEWDAKQGFVGNLKSSCTDNAKITRKQSKQGKHGHGNGRIHKSQEIAIKGETERITKKEAQNKEREKRAVVAERRIAALQCSKMIKGIILSANDFKRSIHGICTKNVSLYQFRNGTFDYKSCCKFHGNELATALRKRFDDGSIMAHMRKLTGCPSNVFGDQVPNCDSETDEAALVIFMRFLRGSKDLNVVE
ncbi:reverse transcriptase domain-containing protein, partial [Tanacetum coccineum]